MLFQRGCRRTSRGIDEFGCADEAHSLGNRVGLGQLPVSLKCHTLPHNPLSRVPALSSAFLASVSFDLPSAAVSYSGEAIISQPQKKLTGAREIPRQASISVTPNREPWASDPWRTDKHHPRMYGKSESQSSGVR